MKNTCPILVAFLLAAASLFSQNQKGVTPVSRLSNQPVSQTRAVVIGISSYQDPDVPDLRLAHRDAEAFATFLQSEAGGSLPKENIMLLTNEQGTGARIAAALDWLYEEPRNTGQVIVYFAGYGESAPAMNRLPSWVLMNDSPLSLRSASTFFNLAAYFSATYKSFRIPYALYFNIFPLVLTPDMSQGFQYKTEGTSRWSGASMSMKNTLTERLSAMSLEEVSNSKITLNNLLLDGLLGLADKDRDWKVDFWELNAFLKKSSIVPETWPGMLFVVVPEREMVLSHADEKTLQELHKHRDNIFPSIIHLETSAKEDTIMAKAHEHVRFQYQDFIVALKLGRLMPPQSGSASALYDTLVLLPELKPLHNDMRRKLAAALLDETQIVLNAYLRSDTRELSKRTTDARYEHYPAYLQRAIELFGPRHYLLPILRTKQYYFQGLLARFAFDRADTDTIALHEALALQQKAIEQEPEAAFVLNEIGVISERLRNNAAAVANFQKAADLAPNWCIPFANLCLLESSEGHHDLAIQHGIRAVALSPKNAFVYNCLSSALLRTNDFEGAEKLLLRAINYDPGYADTYYGLACVKSRQGQASAAIEWLTKAFKAGYNDRRYFESDRDLDNIRELSEFKTLMARHFPETKR